MIESPREKREERAAAKAIVDEVAKDRRAARSLRRVYFAPDDMEARTDMSLASLYSGMDLAKFH